MAEAVSLDELREEADLDNKVAVEAAKTGGTDRVVDTQDDKPIVNQETEFELTLEDDEPASNKQQLDVPQAVHIHKLRKLKEQKRVKDDEIQLLRQEVESLKLGSSIPQQGIKPVAALVPKLSDFDYDEDQYQQALSQHFSDQMQSVAKTQIEDQQQQVRQDQHLVKLSNQVDEHLNRVSSFVEKNAQAGLTVDMYVNAETTVRNALDPDSSGVIDQVVAHLGQGSEQVMYFLGRNTGELLKVQQMLKSDQNGISALMYLGGLKEKLAIRQTRSLSQAPDPDKSLTGGIGGTSSSSYQKQLKKAEDKGDIQTMITIRKQAREAGVKLE